MPNTLPPPSLSFKCPWNTSAWLLLCITGETSSQLHSAVVTNHFKHEFYYWIIIIMFHSFFSHLSLCENQLIAFTQIRELQHFWCSSLNPFLLLYTSVPLHLIGNILHFTVPMFVIYYPFQKSQFTFFSADSFLRKLINYHMPHQTYLDGHEHETTELSPLAEFQLAPQMQHNDLSE